MRRLDLSELELVVHPQDLRGRLRDNGLDRTSVAHGGADAVGQIVLPLRVVGLERPEPAAKPGGGRGQNAGVDLGDGPLLVVRVLVLDDPRHAAGGVADHAAVTRGVVEPGGQQRE